MAGNDRRNKPKGEGNIYVYNMAAAAAAPPPPNAVSKGWGSLMRSKTYKEIRRDKEKVVVVAAEGGGGEAAAVVVERRKSVSSVPEAERRSSVSYHQMEANVRSVAAFLQVKVLVSDMAGYMQVHAFRCARATYDGLDKFSSKHMAYTMKKVINFIIISSIFVSVLQIRHFKHEVCFSLISI